MARRSLGLRSTALNRSSSVVRMSPQSIMTSVSSASTSSALPRLPLASDANRNLEAPCAVLLIFGTALASPGRRIHRHGKLRDVATLGVSHLAHALLLDLVDAQDRMHRQVRPLHARELGLYFFFRGIDDDRRARAEHELLDLDESEQRAVAHAPRVHLVDLALVQEEHLVDRLGGHRSQLCGHADAA